jgi:hypothetical protein
MIELQPPKFKVLYLDKSSKQVDSNPKAEEDTIAMQKYNNKQTTRFSVAYVRLFLQVFSKFQNFLHFPKHFIIVFVSSKVHLSHFSTLQCLFF